MIGKLFLISTLEVWGIEDSITSCKEVKSRYNPLEELTGSLEHGFSITLFETFSSWESLPFFGYSFVVLFILGTEVSVLFSATGMMVAFRLNPPDYLRDN